MVDFYWNFEELAADPDNVYGVDYHIDNVLRSGSKVSQIAIHGGGIEAGTTEMARQIAAQQAQNYYSFVATMPSNNQKLHITSTHYDEPQCLAMQDKVNFTCSWHGFTGVTGVRKTLMGGLDTVKRDAIMNALNAAGFTAEIASEELNGDSPSNITNKNRRYMGVQLEVSRAERQAWFQNGDLTRANREAGNYTPEFFAYAQVIADVTADWDTGYQFSENYHLNIARPQDSMADFETWINANWDKITAVPSAPTVVTSTLPQSGAYNLGDRIFHTPTASIYILICKDADWGWWWRPVQAPMSPWQDVPVSALKTPVEWDLAPFSTRPLQIALDNSGRAYWRGVIKYTAAASMVPNTSYFPFKYMPFGFRPRETDFFPIGHQNLELGSSPLQFARIYIPEEDSEYVSIRVQGGATTPTDLHTFYFNGSVNYAIGAGHYVIP